jgi:DNA polymerase-1
VSIGVFESGGDIHHQNAADLFGTTAVSKAMRNYAKTFLYGISYGGEAESLKLKDFCPCWRCVDLAPPQVNLSRDDVIKSADRWKSRHSCVFTWREALLDSVKGFGKDHTYTSPFGCRRVFMEPREVCKRSLFDYPMQHCAAMVVNRAMRRLHEEYAAPIVLQMHDSLMLEVPEVEADTWDEQLREVMEAPVPELGGVVFPTTASRGETWGSLEEVGGGVT